MFNSKGCIVNNKCCFCLLYLINVIWRYWWLFGWCVSLLWVWVMVFLCWFLGMLISLFSVVVVDKLFIRNCFCWWLKWLYSNGLIWFSWFMVCCNWGRFSWFLKLILMMWFVVCVNVFSLSKLCWWGDRLIMFVVIGVKVFLSGFWVLFSFFWWIFLNSNCCCCGLRLVNWDKVLLDVMGLFFIIFLFVIIKLSDGVVVVCVNFWFIEMG